MGCGVVSKLDHGNNVIVGDTIDHRNNYDNKPLKYKHREENVRVINNEDELKKDDSMEKKEGKQEDENSEQNENTLAFCPGSPSFRIYCIYGDEQSNTDNEDDNLIDEKKEVIIEKTSKKELEAKSPLKRRLITRKFNGVLHKGGSTGMKNILNVSCKSGSN